MGRKLTEVASKLASQTTPRQVVYIVDFENIPKTDVAVLLLEANVSMVVLAANHTNTVTPATLRTIEANPERIEVIIGRVTRKEFVDKLVTAKIGEYAFRFPLAEIIVLANDKDYADLAVHLNDHWERAVPIRHVAPDGPRSRVAGKGRRSGGRAAPNVIEMVEVTAAAAAGADEPKKRASRRGRGGRKRPTAEAAAADVTVDATRADGANAAELRAIPTAKTTREKSKEPTATVAASEADAATAKTKAATAKTKAATAKTKAATARAKGATGKAMATAAEAEVGVAKPAKAAKTPRARAKKAPKETPEPPRDEVAASATSTNPDANVILALLSKMPIARRPKSAASLLNAVRNYREAMGLRSRPTTIIKHLQARGLLDADVSPIAYNLDAGT